MKELKIDPRIESFVKAIYLLEDIGEKHQLPFYADGYPGIMYSESDTPVILNPIGKQLPALFLYGQTIEPINLVIHGDYKLIVFQLYPFATRLLINVNPREMNDSCYDLFQLPMIDTESVLQEIISSETVQQVKLIGQYILDLIKHTSTNQDKMIKLAVSTIINTKGTISIKDLRDQLFVSERTFERKFHQEIGVTAKQFCKIIQFSFSLNQMKDSDYYKLTDVAYNNNFTDQSHFIKTFKKYTGQTPKAFLNNIN